MLCTMVNITGHKNKTVNWSSISIFLIVIFVQILLLERIGIYKNCIVLTLKDRPHSPNLDRLRRPSLERT